jgi:hypothetical protein
VVGGEVVIAATLAALGSALLYAVASVGQQRLAAAAPARQSLRLGLLVGLARRPLWLASMLADLGGYGLQAVALGAGPLVVVQPLLLSGLLFALPLGGALSGRSLSRAEWLAAVAVSGGLSLFLVAAAPRPGQPDATTGVWLAAGVVTAAAVAAAVAAARGPQGPRRAALLGLASGLTFGLTAALTKTSVWLLGQGLGRLAGSWQPYGLAAAGLVGLLLSQSAFQAGPLAVSLATLSVVDPVASIVLGAVAFHESVRLGGVAPVLELVGLAAALGGTVGLAGAAATPHT